MLEKKIIVFLVVLISFGLYGTSLWKDRNLFSSKVIVNVGDIIKIRFAYKNIIRYKNEMKSGTSRQFSLTKPGIKIFSFLPSFDFNAMSKNNSQVDFSTEKEFKTTIAVTVRNIQNKKLAFQGTHSIIVNGQQEQVLISGQVSNDDLKNGKVVYSTDIANLSFEYRGPNALKKNLIKTNDLKYTVITNTNANGKVRFTFPTLSGAARRRLIHWYLNRVSDLLFKE